MFVGVGRLGQLCSAYTHTYIRGVCQVVDVGVWLLLNRACGVAAAVFCRLTKTVMLVADQPARHEQNTEGEAHPKAGLMCLGLRWLPL